MDKADTDDEILQLNVTLQDVLDSLKDNFHLSKADISSIISEASEYSKAVKVLEEHYNNNNNNKNNNNKKNNNNNNKLNKEIFF